MTALLQQPRQGHETKACSQHAIDLNVFNKRPAIVRDTATIVMLCKAAASLPVRPRLPVSAALPKTDLFMLGDSAPARAHSFKLLGVSTLR